MDKFAHNDEVITVIGGRHMVVDKYDPKNTGLVLCYWYKGDVKLSGWFQEHQIEKMPVLKNKNPA